MSPATLKLAMNLYPPYWGTGISVKAVSHDFRNVRVEMKRRWYNSNYMHTHFGGSLYAMVDDIMEKTARGEKYQPEYPVEILDEQGYIVAMVTKQLYIRKKA